MGSLRPAALKAMWDAYDAAESFYVSWHTGDPGTTGANEYTANAAARVVTGGLTSSSDADSADVTNDAAIASAAATGAWTEITHVGLWDAQTGGTFLGGHQLAAGITLALGEKIQLPAGDLNISLPNA